MHYYIDGYNLLFRLVHDDEDLQSRREAIIYDLNQKISLVKIDASIVFDSTSQMGGRTQSHYHELEILFTAEGETADEYILDEIKNAPHPEQEIVVTSDKKLAWRARHRSAHTESVEEFILWLNRAYKNKIRELNKEKKIEPKAGSRTSSPTPSSPLPPKTPSKSLVLPKDAPLEAYADYYQQIFESEWLDILKEEKEREATSNVSSPQKRPPRKPKKKQDPFAPHQTPEEKAATEMERWLKIFEQRSKE